MVVGITVILIILCVTGTIMYLTRTITIGHTFWEEKKHPKLPAGKTLFVFQGKRTKKTRVSLNSRKVGVDSETVAVNMAQEDVTTFTSVQYERKGSQAEETMLLNDTDSKRSSWVSLTPDYPAADVSKQHASVDFDDGDIWSGTGSGGQDSAVVEAARMSKKIIDDGTSLLSFPAINFRTL